MPPNKGNKKRQSRNLSQTRSIILGAAFGEFFKNGFHATSVDSILEKTHLTKGALFHQFPTKLDLGYAVVDEVLIKMIDDRWIKPLADFENPLDGVLSQLRKNMGDLPQQQLNLGCPLNNLVQEMSNSDAIFQKHLSKALEFWIHGIDTHLRRGQENGSIKKEVKTREVAVFIVTMHEGFYGMIKGMRDKSLFKSLESGFVQYFAQLRSK